MICLKTRFSFSFDRQEYRLLLADIVSIETDGNYLRITDQEGKVYRTRMTFTHAQTQLDQRFLSLMKGITVNMDYIVQIKDTVCYMQGGASFPMRVKNAKELKQNWLNYKFTAIREATDIAGGPEPQSGRHRTVLHSLHCKKLWRNRPVFP